MKCDSKIVQSIMKEFGSLWHCHERGQTVEISTPLVTLSSKFVGVYVTEKNGQFFVSDVGEIYKGSYDVELDFDSFEGSDSLMQYRNYFKVLDTEDIYGNPVFYKKTNDIDLIGTIVYELAHFIQGVINSCYIHEGLNREEIKQRNVFRTHVDGFLRSFLNQELYTTNKAIFEGDKSVRFNAIVRHPQAKVTVIKYVTGADEDSFYRSIAKADFDFRLARNLDRKNVMPIIKNQIALVNDTAKGYNAERFALQMSELHKNENMQEVLWKNREELIGILV